MLTGWQRAEMGREIMKIVGRKEITRPFDDANISASLFAEASVSLERRVLSSDEIFVMIYFFLDRFPG